VVKLCSFRCYGSIVAAGNWAVNVGIGNRVASTAKKIHCGCVELGRVLSRSLSPGSTGFGSGALVAGGSVMAYGMGFAKAAAPLIGPINTSREIARKFFAEKGYRTIIGEGGYYAFVNCNEPIQRGGYADSDEFVQYMAQNYGIAVIPGIHFSEAGKNWIRFSYALPRRKPEKHFKSSARRSDPFEIRIHLINLVPDAVRG
jgi:hypothetical protein